MQNERQEGSSQDSPRKVAETQADVSMFCPQCEVELVGNHCKLICPRCGYYMSCSDYY